MPNYDVLGKSVIVEIKIGSSWFPIFCATNNEFGLEQDEIETTNVNSGPNREYVPGMANSTVSLSGITRIVNDDSRANIIYLVQQSVRRQVHELRMVSTDQVSPAPNVSVMSFSAFIKSTTITSDKTILSNSSITFRVTGGVTFDTVVPDPVEATCEVQDPLYIDTVAGQSSVSNPLLEAAGVVILEVQREGIGQNETTGTPSGNRFKFTGGAGNGTIAFDPLIPFNSGEVIYVLFKITS